MHPADDNALNTEERIWDLTMQINLKGVWWGCKYAILAMRNNPTDKERGLHTGGSIINTASFVALMGAATPQLACASLHIASPLGNEPELPCRYGFQRWCSCDDQRTCNGSCEGGYPRQFLMPVRGYDRNDGRLLTCLEVVL